MIEKLILLVSQHRQFGWKISIHLSEELTGESLLLKGIPSVEQEKKKGRSNEELQLIETVNKISDKVLLRAYSKGKEKTDVSKSAVDNLIRPRMDMVTYQILELTLQANIPVYIKEDIKSKAISEYNRLEISSESYECIFNFIKDKEGLRYFISLHNQYNTISLQQKRVIVLSDKPCIVLLGSIIYRVENIEAKKLIPFFTKTAIHVPETSEKDYIRKFIVKTIPKYEVNIQGINVSEIFPKKKAVLTLEEDFNQQLYLSLHFEYNQQIVFHFSEKKKIAYLSENEDKESIVWFYRDKKWERKYITTLQKLNLQSGRDNRFYLNKEETNKQYYGLIEWLNRHHEEFKKFQIIQKVGQDFYQGAIEVISRMDVKIDWFDLKIEVVLDNFRIPFACFKKHILSCNPEYVLPDGRIFILPKEWFNKYHDLFLYSEAKNDELNIRKIYAPLLHNSLDAFMPEDRKQDITELLAAKIEYPTPASKLDNILRPYQRKGFYWLNHLRNMNFGGCLADDMGLGKTLQTITLLEHIYASSPTKEQSIPASLIVVPTSLLHNWKNELKKFAPKLKIYLHAGTRRLKSKDIGKIFKHYQIIITTYGTLRMDVDYLNTYLFEYVILDESQYIKNPSSVLYRSVQSLKANHRLVLTGTPIENSLIDLWTQFSFINPGILGSLSFFRENFINKIQKEHNQQTEDSLRHLIRPFILRRTKEEVAPDLPLLSQEIVYCDMTDAQEEVYKEEKNNIRNQLLTNTDLFVKNKFIALQSLMRLRLLANHPILTKPDYLGDSGKYEQILFYFETIQAGGHKVLIFSSFVKHLRLLTQTFDERGWKYAFLSGQTQNREEEINKFNNNKETNCFFISLKAGGTGLNLTSADYVFIIDPWWNPAVEMQALSRAHRIGQEKNVMVYRFISGNTIEEKIIRLQESKSKLSETFIDSQSSLKDLSSKELKELFR
ncbi:hypothetical protein LJB92_03230 [Bacteroidales bacterium OttesenSCG-928-M06]|nr:hypothetical protein [Bacteroidales bacterium OttesenSCG-928-M06]